MADSIIKVENLVKSFGDHEVLKKIDFEISKGEVYVLSVLPVLVSQHF